MAVTSTHASARTHTRARLEALLMQVDLVLRKTADADDYRIKLFELGLRKRWIKQISVYAFDPQQEALAGLRLEVDWSTHDQKAKTAPTVTVKSEDGSTIDTKGYTSAFQRAVAMHAGHVAETDFRVRYTDEVYANPELDAHVNQVLDLETCDGVVWRDGKRDERHCSDDALAELGLLVQWCVEVI